MSVMGRPRKEIDYEEFEKLCGLHCTLEDVCGWYEMTEDTLNTRLVERYGETFSGVYKRFSSLGKVSLRRVMFENAMKGNTTMQIWLSKQHLEMKDQVEQKNHNLNTNVTYDSNFADGTPTEHQENASPLPTP